MAEVSVVEEFLADLSGIFPRMSETKRAQMRDLIGEYLDRRVATMEARGGRVQVEEIEYPGGIRVGLDGSGSATAVHFPEEGWDTAEHWSHSE